jgi:hypothetical protein
MGTVLVAIKPFGQGGPRNRGKAFSVGYFTKSGLHVRVLVYTICVRAGRIRGMGVR